MMMLMKVISSMSWKYDSIVGHVATHLSGGNSTQKFSPICEEGTCFNLRKKSKQRMSSPLVLSIVAPEDHWMFVHTSIEKVVTRPSAWLAVRALLRRCAKTKPLADVTHEDVRSLYVPCRHRGCGLVCQRIRTEMWDVPSDVPVTLSVHWTLDLDLHVTEQAVCMSMLRRSILHQLQR